MAKSRYTISMDYTRAVEQAERLEKLAGSLSAVANDSMNSCFSQIRSAWKRNSSDAYIQKGQKVQTDILKLSKNLRSAANTIRTVAKNTRDMELRALEIAQSRTYK